MPHSDLPLGDTYNNNNGDGTFNQVNGDQHFDYSAAHNGDIIQGDQYQGPIHGGNVGGRNNTNTIYNGAPPTADPLNRYGGVRGDSKQEMRGLEARADDLQSEIDRIMDEMGLNAEEKLERKILDLQVTLRALNREAMQSQRSDFA
ncbi:hypothetical protein EYR36_001149 [Pleurotus pulmonarius]|nr:hypothetical protein EYR36_004231 [Pleurotus pulmonarius]KAF4579339.1 hypothetical protein EYR36_001149 [Pleurotus pulmonarius]KAF4603328.1 hypothetical protein EYR38_003741 [Pleurotus pulmonarius]